MLGWQPNSNLRLINVVREEVFVVPGPDRFDTFSSNSETSATVEVVEEVIHSFFILIWNKSNNRFFYSWTQPGTVDIETNSFEFPDYIFNDPMDYYRNKSSLTGAIKAIRMNQSNLFVKTPHGFDEQVLIYKLSNYLEEMTM